MGIPGGMGGSERYRDMPPQEDERGRISDGLPWGEVEGYIPAADRPVGTVADLDASDQKAIDEIRRQLVMENRTNPIEGVLEILRTTNNSSAKDGGIVDTPTPPNA